MTKCPKYDIRGELKNQHFCPAQRLSLVHGLFCEV
jgi:hypothetical protein